jgi:HKD family nuclease
MLYQCPISFGRSNLTATALTVSHESLFTVSHENLLVHVAPARQA